jgi:hypothetical protein
LIEAKSNKLDCEGFTGDGGLRPEGVTLSGKQPVLAVGIDLEGCRRGTSDFGVLDVYG